MVQNGLRKQKMWDFLSQIETKDRENLSKIV